MYHEEFLRYEDLAFTGFRLGHVMTGIHSIPLFNWMSWSFSAVKVLKMFFSKSVYSRNKIITARMLRGQLKTSQNAEI